jgi:acyl-coenzyme A thioesterase PaaI-like protein
MSVPHESSETRHHLFTNSFVSGASNPLGLGATLRRDGDVAVMNVVLGRAFEGAPGRAHGGVVAALLDETMGLVLALQGVLAFTAQLDITYVAPTPLGEELTARAWLSRRENRKLYINAEVYADASTVASAEALFITVNPTTFLEHVTQER